MKRSLYAIAAAVLLAVALSSTANAATSVDVRVSVGDRYHGATLAFRNEPQVVLVPDTKVYYTQNEDCDLYRYGHYWYFVEDGRWYRSATWRGPFLNVRLETVPRSVVTVPVRYRHHWNGGPPAHAVARGYRRNHREVREYRGEEHAERGGYQNQGHGHDNGHDKGSKHNGD
jgi:hypothetical protein